MQSNTNTRNYTNQDQNYPSASAPGQPYDQNGPSSSPYKETHDVIIVDCQPVKHEDGYPVINWTFEYLNGPRAGSQFLDISRLRSEAAKKYFRDVCERLGSPFQNGDKVSGKCSGFIGKRVKLNIRTSIYIDGLATEPESLKEEYMRAYATTDPYGEEPDPVDTIRAEQLFG